MTERNQRVEDELLQRVAERATGVLDVRDDQKRWMVFLVDGQVVHIRSNLKSEQAAAIQASHPNLAGAALERAQALRSLHNMLRLATTQFTFRAGVTAKERAELPTLTLLLRAVGTAMKEDQLLQALSPLLEGFPRTTAAVDNLGMSDELTGFVDTLDGRRRGREAVDFAPGPRPDALSGLWLAWKLGRIEVGSEPLGASVRPGAGSLDIAALIADAFDEVAPEPPPPAPTPEVGQASGSSHVITGIPRRRTVTVEPDPEPPPTPEPPPAPVLHPLDGHVRALHARVTSAANHFELFGLPWDAPVEDFRQAHLGLAQDLHPDRLADAPPELQDLATEAFDKVRAAWEVLSDDEKRQKYTDKVVHGKKTEEELAMEQVQNYWDAEADFKRGIAAFNAGRLKQAHEMFTAAVERVPDELEFRAYFAYTTWQTERTRDPARAESAVDSLKDVLDKNKDQERKLDMAWVLLGRIYRDKAEDKVARRCFVQALRINPANADASREMRRLSGGEPGKKPKADEKKGFLSGLFGKKR